MRRIHLHSVAARGKAATVAAEVFVVAGRGLTDEVCREYVRMTSVMSTDDVSGEYR
jgi:hypothetical protein